MCQKKKLTKNDVQNLQLTTSACVSSLVERIERICKANRENFVRNKRFAEFKLNLLGEQKRAQSANLRSVCLAAQVDGFDKLRAI